MTTPDWLDPSAARTGWRQRRAPRPVLRSTSCGSSPAATTPWPLERLDPGRRRASVLDQTVDGPAGPIPVRILTPPDGPGEATIVYFHAWWLGARRSRHASRRRAAPRDPGRRGGRLGRLPAGARAPVPGRVRRRLGGHRVGLGLAAERHAADYCRAAKTSWWSSRATARAGSWRRRLPWPPVTPDWPWPRQLLLYPPTDLRGHYADPAINAAYPSRTEHADGPGSDPRRHGVLRRHLPRPRRGRRLAGEPGHREPDRGRPGDRAHRRASMCCRPKGTSSPRRCRRPGCPSDIGILRSLNHSYFPLGGISAAADAAATQAADDLRELLGLAPR